MAKCALLFHNEMITKYLSSVQFNAYISIFSLCSSGEAILGFKKALMMIYQRCVKQGWHALQRQIFNVPFHSKPFKTTPASRSTIHTEIIPPSSNNSRLPCIQKLLYQAYIREQKWKFDIKNPSGIILR